MSEVRHTIRHLNLPLEEDLYRRLRAEADRTGRPATRIVRQAIVRFLDEVHRSAVHEAIASYAAAVAGSKDDIDPELESAAAEFLREGDDAAPSLVREKPAKRPREPKRRGAKGR